MKKQLIVGVAVLLVATAGVSWFLLRPEKQNDHLKLHGNVDIRQVSLAFDGSERIAALYAEEGDLVQPGQVLAELDTRTLRLEINRSKARVGAQEQALLRLKNGTRPQEVEQSKARFDAAQAQMQLAQLHMQRLRRIADDTQGKGVSQQRLDQAAARLQVAKAQSQEQRESWTLAKIGPRNEDIAQATADLQASRADLDLLEHYLARAQLKAPTQARIRTRLLEPGDMASPQRPVFALALTDPKWVRAYVNERQLGHIRADQMARVYTDSFPDQAIDGKVGYISSVAEFTPKSVETEDLRTSLVYEIRVLVKDPDDRLRLGMPATVYLDQAPVAGATP
ncbi:HlyD family efflux transporter periplasmic adaptor subunit [Pseudomonas protegens]|uniref:HlyD family efflux transporter periplasmic adaptor subunit n=1 Tax=Pseudomonas protegens TaxID=380021 RepID=UPI0013726248|nr:HlyD family efflux transporter periplasmic adaptor subunit [Pseudomonas protegens]NAN53637.1 HlyD family efflux transporter periplasmic adaptor subunit [Pseudomonas protegens]NUE78102.1 HlyD family efflux transporter periplasmic adaptor subunit [Pseudomonas protegens]